MRLEAERLSSLVSVTLSSLSVWSLYHAKARHLIFLKSMCAALHWRSSIVQPTSLLLSSGKDFI